MNATSTPTRTREFNGMQYPISAAHPAADLFPWLPHDELAALADDIRDNGQQDVILRLPDGRLIDGRNREIGCRIAGVEPRYETVSLTEDEVIDLVVSKNLHRRNLTTGEKALIASELAQMGRGRRKSNGPRDAFTQSGAAALLGTSRKSVQRATVVRREAPELVALVKEDKLDICTAAKVAVRPEGERQQVVIAANPKQVASRLLDTPRHSAAERLAVSELEKARRGFVSAWNAVQELIDGPWRDQVMRVAAMHNVPIYGRDEPTTDLQRKLGSAAIETTFSWPVLDKLQAFCADLKSVTSGQLELEVA